MKRSGRAPDRPACAGWPRVNTEALKACARFSDARMPDYRPELAEFLGAFSLVFVGCGAIAVERAGISHAGGPFAIALAFGLTITVLVYALGHVSGAHFNPAVTAAFTASGHFPARRAVTYVAAQVAGAAAAAFLLKAVLPDGTDVGVTRPVPHLLGAALVAEVAITAILMLVIMSVATDRRAAPGAAGLAIGGVIVVGAIAAGGLSGGSFNPARSLGPALAMGQFEHVWVYLTAPFAGALLGALLYETLRGGDLAPQRFGREEALGALGRVSLVRRAARVLEPSVPPEVQEATPKAERADREA